MAVKTSVPLSLSEILVEVYGSSNTSGKTLMNTFTSANATGEFDPTYAATGSMLLEFRGFKDPPNISSIGSTGSTSTTIDVVFGSYDNVAVTSQTLWWKTTSGGSWVSISVASNATGYTLSGLSPSTSYSFYIVSCDGASNCTTSSTQSRSTTAAPDTTFPVFNTQPYVSQFDHDNVDVYWTKSDNVGITSQTFYWRANSDPYSSVVLSTGATSRNTTGLSPSTPYNFYVRICDAAGNCTTSNIISQTTSAAPDTIAPTVGTMTYDGSAGPGEFDVSWTASSDNVGVTEHSFWYKKTTESVYIKYSTTYSNGNAGSLRMTGLDLGTDYHVKLRATDAAGNFTEDKVRLCTTGTAITSTLSVSPTFRSVTSSSGSFTITVTSNTNWSVSDNATWISVSPTSGSNNGSVTVTHQTNTGGFRAGRVTFSATGVTSKFCDVDQDGASGGCLVDGTNVLLSDGSISLIENLKEGDKLLVPAIENFTDTNDITELYRVELQDVNIYRASTMIKKIVRELAPVTYSINKGLLQATGQHTQLIKSNNIWVFKRLGSIIPGDYLLDSNDKEVLVETIERVDEPRYINKLTLEDPYHTFYANKIVTHNIKDME